MSLKHCIIHASENDKDEEQKSPWGGVRLDPGPPTWVESNKNWSLFQD